MSLTHSRDYPRSSDPPDHSHILSAISELKNDKLALKAALKSAIAKREEMAQRLAMYEESVHDQAAKRKEIERENGMLRRDNGGLAHRAEEYRRQLEQVLSTRDEDQRLIQQLTDRAKALEDASIARKRSRLPLDSFESNPIIDSDIQKYSQFMLEKLEEDPNAMNLFRGRVGSLRGFWSNIQSRKYSECVLSLAQFVSDLMVYRSHSSRPGTHLSTIAASPEPVQPSKKSSSTQTLSDQGTNTSGQFFTAKPERTMSFAPTRSESVSKPRPLADLPGYMFSTSSTSNGDGFISPTSTKSVAFSLRGDDITFPTTDDYSKLMDESEHLLTSLHQQSDRLVKLNSQIQHTMHSGPTRKSPLYAESSQSMFSRTDSVSPTKIPYIGIPSSPKSLKPVIEREKKEEISTEKDLVVEESYKPEMVESAAPPQRKVGSSVGKLRTVRKPMTTLKTSNYKTDVSPSPRSVSSPVSEKWKTGALSPTSSQGRKTSKRLTTPARSRLDEDVRNRLGGLTRHRRACERGRGSGKCSKSCPALSLPRRQC